MIFASDDAGETWSDASVLTDQQEWHQAPCNVHYANGHVYLVMERVTDMAFKGWPVSKLAPVVMAGRLIDDLLEVRNWTFSNELVFDEAVGCPSLMGVPFHTVGELISNSPESPSDERRMEPPGWLETHLIQFVDPSHVWHDSGGRTLYLWARAHTGTTNLACIAKVLHRQDGSLYVDLARAPSGEPVAYMPCPGGQSKFHILYDDLSKLYWLASSQSTDSMSRVSAMPRERIMPHDQRDRLSLHFSRNCVDWCFAGLVTATHSERMSRSYPAMVIDGDDLHLLVRSGDGRAKSAHDGNLITFHTVQQFRTLVY